MTDLVQLLVAGISIGAIYAMAAIGFVLLWQTSGTINFAQGEFVVVPAFTMVLFLIVFRLPFAAALVGTVLVSTLLLGVLVHKVLVARLLRMGCSHSSSPRSASACSSGTRSSSSGPRRRCRSRRSSRGRRSGWARSSCRGRN